MLCVITYTSCHLTKDFADHWRCTVMFSLSKNVFDDDDDDDNDDDDDEKALQ
jgi:hypothetical protein